eukprot:m.20051 g.20051  ORF g.20051 m.20051 type:complete len:338 (+) comp10480_c0_seq1:47-1060(+)
MASDNIELTSVGLHAPSEAHDGALPNETEIVVVSTEFGPLRVTVQGDLSSPLMITYHDIGLDHTACFQNMMCYPPSRALADVMCIAHIDAPGQTRDAPSLPPDYQFPSIDQMADQVAAVLDALKAQRCVCFGAGVGGNILLRFAEKHPERVLGLILCGVNAFRAQWTEWALYKAVIHYLTTTGTVTKFCEDTILSYLFSPNTLMQQLDMVNQVRDHLRHHVNPHNLARFLQAYISRPDFSAPLNKDFRPSVLLVGGHSSPYCDEMETLNSRLNPARTSYLKIFNMGNNVQEEYPMKVLEATLLFLQGLGLASGSVMRLHKLSQRREQPEDRGVAVLS